MIWRVFLAFLILAPGSALAQSVTISAAAARDGGVKTERLPLIKFTPSRQVYGIVRDPAPLVSLDAAIVQDKAQLTLGNATLKRTQQLYHAAHNVSEASLEQAQASQVVAAARLAADKAKLAARYGAALASSPRIAAVAAGRASLIEVTLGLQSGAAPQAAPPDHATAQGPGGKTLSLRLIGPAGSVPAGLLGQSYYYVGPVLASGMPLSVSLPEGGKRPGYAVPPSALIYGAGKVSVFTETAPKHFAMVAVPMDHPIGGQDGQDGYFVPQDALPGDDPVAVKGAGLLLSVAKHHNAPAKAADSDDD